MEKKRIPTFVVNLPQRIDRRRHILNEFGDRPEFDLTLVEAIRHEQGYLGLWQSIASILVYAIESDEEYILICEDDHEFTPYYNESCFRSFIAKAQAEEADVLLGGVSATFSPWSVGNGLVWTEKFTGLQFAIIFKKFYRTLLLASSTHKIQIDHAISKLSTKVYIVTPFISVQKEFGYSDINDGNAATNFVSNLFKESQFAIDNLMERQSSYRDIKPWLNKNQFCRNICSDVYVPVIKIDYRLNIHEVFYYTGNQYSNEPIRDIKTTTITTYHSSAWEALLAFTSVCVDENHDFFVVQATDFTAHCSLTLFDLLYQIVDAYRFGFDILAGNMSNDFTYAFKIDSQKFWVNDITESTFFIVYRSLFDKILTVGPTNQCSIMTILSSLAANRAVMCPFASETIFSSRDETDKVHYINQLVFLAAQERLSRLSSHQV